MSNRKERHWKYEKNKSIVDSWEREELRTHYNNMSPRDW